MSLKTWYDSKFEPLPGEPPEEYTRRMAHLAWTRTIQLAVCTAALVILAIVFACWFFTPSSPATDVVTLGEYNVVAGKYNTLVGQFEKYKQTHPDTPASVPVAAAVPASGAASAATSSANMCPVPGSVVITTDEYNKLKEDAAKCATKPKAAVMRKPKPKREVIITEPRQQWSGPALPAPNGAADWLPGPAPAISSRIWLWHPHNATSENPMPCIVDSGRGAGLPPYCSSFSVKSRQEGEAKPEWLLRVGGGVDPTDTGLYHKPGKTK
jgi:hypothetical protein